MNCEFNRGVAVTSNNADKAKAALPRLRRSRVPACLPSETEDYNYSSRFVFVSRWRFEQTLARSSCNSSAPSPEPEHDSGRVAVVVFNLASRFRSSFRSYYCNATNSMRSGHEHRQEC